MKKIKFSILLIALLVFGCDQSENKTTSYNEQTISDVLRDKENIQKIIRQLYEWHETKSSKNDFNPTADELGINYIGLNLDEHLQRLNELKQTNYFGEQFLKNYDKIARTIDNGLKNKTIQWKVGDLPPFGNDANPWCNCQDNPEKYWLTMTVSKIKFNNKTATFCWTWGSDFEYKAKAIKENGSWKISYLQGFDFNEFILSK